MSLTKEQLKAEAMKLDWAEREALAEELFLSIDPAERETIDAAMLAEAKRRDAAYRRGEMQGKPVHEVIDRLLKKAN